MIQLEFEPIVECCRCEVPTRPARCRAPRRVLDFMRLLLNRKYRRKLYDIDLMVMLALAQRSPLALRFVQVLDLLPGASQTSVWKSLERLDDFGFVAMSGPPGKHVYELTSDGVKELHYLTK